MRRGLVGSVAVALALVVAACGKGGAEEDGASSASSGEAQVKTGPGATADTITLGYLPDLSGVFAPNGKSMMEGANLYWDAKNKAGGICGRQIKLNVQDTGYDPQKAVAAYQQLSGDVIGLGLVLGSSIVSALLPSVQQENMFLNFEGDYGENALKGSKFAAGKHKLEIVEQKITPADQDMTGQVAAFKKAGVKAILFSA